jgi:Holliday junction resolvase-like predicted endonuclease
MSYHNQLIEAFCQDIEFYQKHIGFMPSKIRRNFSIGNGDIDVLLEGHEQRAIIEVKAHEGLLGKFVRVQLPKYQAYFHGAEIYAFTGNTQKSLKREHLRLKKY